MVVKTKEIIDAVSVVTSNHNIRVTVKSSLKSSLQVAGATFIGALTMGPPGIIIGAVAGSIYSYKSSKGTFKSAAVIIRDELTDEQKERLCAHIVEAFREFQIQDLALLMPLLMTNGQFQAVAISKVIQFLTQEMRMEIID